VPVEALPYTAFDVKSHPVPQALPPSTAGAADGTITVTVTTVSSATQDGITTQHSTCSIIKPATEQQEAVQESEECTISSTQALVLPALSADVYTGFAEHDPEGVQREL
jgi:hypothetical protein